MTTSPKTVLSRRDGRAPATPDSTVADAGEEAGLDDLALDDVPYVVPPLEIVATVRVRVKDVGELPSVPYLFDDADQPAEDD